jgi:serine/threonine protein kinase
VGEKVTLIDFNISAVLEHGETLIPADAMGTLGYNAPEVLNVGELYDPLAGDR